MNEETEEKEIASFHVGLVFDDNFFNKKQSLSVEDLLPAFHQLTSKFGGVIKEAGTYAIKLLITKLK